MARDSDKYRIFPIAILRDSWVLDMIEQDAKDHQMPDHVNKLLALRITEYYRLIRDGTISAALLGNIETAAAVANGHHAGGGSKTGGNTTRQSRAAATASTDSPSESGEQQQGSVGLSDNAEENADAALDFFEPLDTDD